MERIDDAARSIRIDHAAKRRDHTKQKGKNEMTKQKETRIKALLDALGWKQTELANALKIHNSEVSKLASGAQPLSKGRAAQIAAATGARAEWLLTGDGDMFAPDISAYEAALSAGASRFVAGLFDRYMALGDDERAAFETVVDKLLNQELRERFDAVIQKQFTTTINNVIDGDHNNVTNRVGD